VFVNRRRDGSLYHEEKAITPMRDDQGRITHFVSTGKDISTHIQYQEQIQHLAQHDQLTDLPNRSLFNDRLQQAIRRADRRGNRVALLFCDLNDFKSINDRFGHHAGDQLLQEVAERLRACGRREDTVARVGGDEFILLLEGISARDEAEGVARRLQQALATPFQVAGEQRCIGVSIGLAFYPDDSTSREGLITAGDRAMYRHKADREGACRSFGELSPAEDDRGQPD
ncbi:MAG TPA: GGDEF domain-containing protein, partial [Gammaproteobacteria bacterium]|nr:GGDEF domain-containing protein [Gammaproteobacteria bacterium]